jgi:hypothetical protein
LCTTISTARRRRLFPEPLLLLIAELAHPHGDGKTSLQPTMLQQNSNHLLRSFNQNPKKTGNKKPWRTNSIQMTGAFLRNSPGLKEERHA